MEKEAQCQSEKPSLAATNKNLSAELREVEKQLKETREDKRRLQAELSRVKAKKKQGDAQVELASLMSKITINDNKQKKLQKDVDLLKHRISKHLNKWFNVLLQKIQLVNQEKCSRILQTAFQLIIEKMRQADSLFNLMYRCPVYTGSYYEKLRIKDACEFDINLVLAHPVKSKTIKINPSSGISSHTTFCVDDLNLSLSDKDMSGLKYLLDDKGYILPSKVLSWIQSVMDLAQLRSIELDGVKEIKATASGPAKTLLIVLNDSARTTISVDLVPVFRFPFDQWPSNLKSLRKSVVDQTELCKRNLYLVPKGYKRGSKQNPHEPAQKDVERVWRVHFAEIESGVLDRKQGAKPVIKLLKLLRDSQGWHGLHSYFLKTLVLNEIAANPRKEWNVSLIAERLREILLKLKSCLDKKTLPHFFFSTVNLLQYMNAAEMANFSQRLDKVFEIYEDPNQVEKYFKV